MTKAIVEILLNHRSDINAKLDQGTDIRDVSRAGITALHLCKSCVIVEILLNNEANIEVRSDERATPLNAESGGGLADVAAALLDNGADTEAKY